MNWPAGTLIGNVGRTQCVRGLEESTSLLCLKRRDVGTEMVCGNSMATEG